MDVTDAAAVRDLAQHAVAELGSIDLWFSNVGVGAIGLFHEVPIEAHRRVIEANLLGHIHDAHAAVPVFLAQGHGIFVNMISLGGYAAAPYATAYSASKFGLRGFAEALRAELADHRHIHVCDVYPAFVDTPGLAHGANYVGRRISAPPPLLDPRSVAEVIFRLAARPRPTSPVGAPTLAVRLGHLLAPQISARAMHLGLKRYFARAEKVPVSEGNLFAPPAAAGGIDGGLRRPAPGPGKAALALGLVALLCLALGRHQPGRRA